MNKKGVIGIIVLLLIIGGAFWLTSKSGGPNDSSSGTGSGSGSGAAGTGRVVVGIADQADSMEGVSSVVISVKGVDLYSASKGWVKVSSESKEYDLWKLKSSGTVSFYNDANVPAGTYSQARITIDDLNVQADGKTQDARLPATVLNLNSTLVVNAGKTSALVFDFKADQSLHATVDGKAWIFTPVVNLQSSTDANVSINADSMVIQGGQNSSTSHGMNAQGMMQSNFMFGGDDTFFFDAQGMWKVGKKMPQ